MSVASAPVVLIQLDLVTIELHLEGTSPLITHAWSEKAKKMMLDKQMGKASKGKEKKDPIADYESSFYRLPTETTALYFTLSSLPHTHHPLPTLAYTTARSSPHTDASP